MDWTHFCLFFASSWLLILTPGPDMLFVVTRGLALGRKAGVLSALGVACGILVHTLMAALGLAIILRTSAMAFAVVKIAGSGYLIFLGIRSLLKPSHLQPGAGDCHASGGMVFLQGLLTNILNPKIALFFLAFLPQFITPGKIPETTQLLMLGVCYAVCSTLFLGAVSFFSGVLRCFIDKKNGVTQLFSRISGCVFIALGLKLFFTKQPKLS